MMSMQDMRRLALSLSRVLLPGVTFVPEAAIVNLYPPGSSLGPHTDHSEPNKSAPLFSVSFGAPAVFLLGGASRADAPTPMLLESGDVLVMAGAARMAYHAVPRVMAPSPSGAAIEHRFDDDAFIDWYLRHHRINLNVRQVH